MAAEVIDKATGKSIQVAGDTIRISDPSVVRLDLDRTQIASLGREDNDLIVRLADGQTIRIANFYVVENGTASDLVLREPDGGMWLANASASGPARFTSLHGMDELLAGAQTADSGGGGGGALLPVLLGLGAAGGLAAAAGGGGGGSGGGSTGGGGQTGAGTGTPDTTPPGAPTASVGATGANVTGTGEAGATIQVRDASGTVIGTGTAGANGAYTVTLTQPQTNGQTVSVTQADAAGNTSAATTAVAPDITAPAAPTAQMDPATLTVSGTAEPGATVTVTDGDGSPLGSTVAGANGAYTVTLPAQEMDGDPVNVTQTDGAGNTSPATSVTTPDLVAPGAPTATVSPDGTAVTGTGEPGATVTIGTPGGTTVGTGVVAPGGDYTVPLPPGTSNGGTLAVTQTDPDGNTSPATTVTTPDLTAPGAPTATVTPDGAAVTGTGEPGATVTIGTPGGTPIGTGTVDPSGTYTVPLPAGTADGGTLSVTQTDPSGNTSPATTVTTPDLAAPATPSATIAPDGGSVTGVGEPGATVTVTGPAGAPIGSATVAGDGSYFVPLAPAQTNGEALQVGQADAAGNASGTTAVSAPDLTAPAAPSATVSADGTSVTGTGEPGATVTVRDSAGNAIGSATVAGDGSFTAPLTPAQANGETLQVGQADAAGNASPSTAVTAPDVTAPLGLTATVDASGGVVAGVGEPGATVTVRDPAGTVIGTATVAANGSYTAPLGTAQLNGETLQVTQADAAGNPSAPVAAVAPDLTAPAAPTGTVSADGTAITGTGEAGATVSVRAADGSVIGTGLVAGDGSFAIPLAPPQANGEQLQLAQTDVAGNLSPATSVQAPDITAPLGLTAAVDAAGTVVSGNGEPGATVTVRDPLGTTIGTGMVAVNGAYAVALTTPQTNGQTLQVSQADAAGNPSTPVPALAPDSTPPATPTLAISADGTTATGSGEPGATVTVTSATGSVLGSGPVAGDGSYAIVLSPAQANGETVLASQADAAGNASLSVSATAPDITPPALPTAAIDATGSVVSGTGEPGATITVRDPLATPIGTATVDAAGNYSVALSTPQLDSQVLSVTQADAAGNPSPAASVTAPDLTAPAAPAGTVAADGASITGTGEIGATVVITDPVGLPIGTALVQLDGTYTAALNPPQTNGQLLGLTQTDGAGNVSPQGSTVAPDLVPNDSPGAPTATVAADGGSVFGTGQPGATVRVTGANGVEIGTGTVTPGGSYVVVLTTPQVNGETVRVTQADAEGDVSPPATAIAPDLTPPAVPVASIDATGTIVTGTGEVGATVRVADAGGTTLGTATVDANGNYAVVLGTPQLNGQALSVTQSDAAANVSPAAPLTAPDITPPAAPTIAVSADGATASGSGEPGATITVTDPAGAPIGTATVTPGGSWTATLTTPQTNGELLTATQADPAGNASPAATATAPDITPPAAPTATVHPSGQIVTGVGEPGATVTVRDATGTPLGTATVAANGAYAVTLSAAQLNGELLQVSQTDPAGNPSPVTPALAPDITAPTAPTATVAADGTAVTGVGEPGATVTIRDAGGVAIGTALVAGNGSYTATLTTPQANGETLSASQADPTGNVSPSVTAVAPDITPPAPPSGVAINGEGTVVTGTGEAGATVEVRDAGGTLIGTTIVAANGSFAAPLVDPQTAGETLSVTLRDPAGNLSGAVPILAPVDIDAFDNSATASIDLVPVTTNENLGSANYLALVSLGLLNLDAQVLATPSVQFTVDPGHTLDATFSYDALLSLGVLSGYSVVVQRFDGTNWVAIEGSGNSSLLELRLLNGDLVATETLGPGDYRAFVTFDGALGAGVLGGLNVTGVDSDYTDVGGAIPAVTSGNVITDPGVGGAVDIVSAQTSVQSVTINGVTTLVAADGTVVDGAWGTLVINRDGSYTYTPDASPAAIGRADVFTYALLDASDGEVETATLTVTVGSPDITGAPVAVGDAGLAVAAYENVETTIAPVLDASFATATALVLNGPQTGRVTDSFTVEANSTADVTLSAIRQGGLAVLPTYTITVTNAQGVVVGTVTQTALAGLPLGSGTSLTLHDLPSGTYSYTVSSTNPLGLGYGTNIYVGQTVTHLDQHAFVSATAAEGDLLANDVVGSAFAAVRVQSAGNFVEVGDTPVTITGQYGTLTVDETGHYTYQPSASLAWSGVDPVDSFTYQIVQPNGAVATAQLDVTVDITNAATPMLAFVDPDSGFGDTVSLAMFAALPQDPPAAAEHAALGFDLIEEQDTLGDMLGRFLDDHQASQDAAPALFAGSSEPAAHEISAAVPEDPFNYLIVPSDLDQDRHMMVHAV